VIANGFIPALTRKSTKTLCKYKQNELLKKLKIKNLFLGFFYTFNFV